MEILFFVLMCIAINHFTDILVNVDLLQTCRECFEKTFPKLAKLATCMFCQSFWLLGISSCAFCIWNYNLTLFAFLLWPVLWFSGHKGIQLLNEMSERYMTRTVLPKAISANISLTLENTEKSTIPMDGIEGTQGSNSNVEIIPRDEGQG